MWQTVMDILNQPVVITLLAGALLWGLNRLYKAKPTWQQYEGIVIEAIKYAEKAIPDDSENTAVARLNAALKYALTVYENTRGRAATDKEKAELRETIPVVHAAMEAEGNL